MKFDRETAPPKWKQLVWQFDFTGNVFHKWRLCRFRSAFGSLYLLLCIWWAHWANLCAIYDMPRFVRQDWSFHIPIPSVLRQVPQPTTEQLSPGMFKSAFLCFRSQIYNNQEHFSQNTSLINRTRRTPCWCLCTVLVTWLPKKGNNNLLQRVSPPFLTILLY